MPIAWLCFSVCKERERVVVLHWSDVLVMMNISAVSNKGHKRDTLRLCWFGEVSHAQCDVIVYFGVGERTRRQNELDKTTSTVLAASSFFLSGCCCCLCPPLRCFFILPTPSPALMRIPLLPLNSCFPLSQVEAMLKSLNSPLNYTLSWAKL